MNSKTNASSGFTLIEILVALTMFSAIFIITTSLIVSLFGTSLKSRQVEVIEQVKNDIQNELSNTVRWANIVTFSSGVLRTDTDSYFLSGGRIYKNDNPITPESIEIMELTISKHSPDNTASAGSGLVGQYYDGIEFEDFKFTQGTPVIDFNWGNSSPDELLGNDNYSIRFVGQLQPLVTGLHTFYIVADGGARLWVNNSLIVDELHRTSAHESTGVIFLTQGRKYDIRVDYRKTFGTGSLSLLWSYPGQSRQIVPASRLYPNTGPVSLEILVGMRMRESISVQETMKMTLSPRSGNISIIEIP